MKKSCRLLSGIATMSLAFTAVIFAHDADAKTLRIGLTDPLSTPHGEAMVQFEQDLEEATDGSIDVQLFPALQLGQIVEQIEGVQLGTQEMMMATPAWFGRFHQPVEVFSLPYLVTNWEQAERMMASEAVTSLWEEAEDATGIRIAGWLPVGFRNVANSERPVTNLGDMEGLRLRLQNSPVQIAAFQALGADPVPLAWSETYQAVQTGVVDGLENSLNILLSADYPKVAPYVSQTRHLFEFFLVFVNEDFYASLTDEERTAFDEAFQAAYDRCLELVLASETTALGELSEAGAEVNELSAEDLAAFAEALSDFYAENGAAFEPLLSEMRAAAADQ